MVNEGSPLHRAAQHVATQLKAAACSIYELQKTSGAFDDDPTFDLVGIYGCEDKFLGPPKGFKLGVQHWLASDHRIRTWLGQTSWVAFSREPMNLRSVHYEHYCQYEDRDVVVIRQHYFSEVGEPGPFVAAPVFDSSGEVVGVVRALRRRLDVPFSAVEFSRLVELTPLLAIGILQERDRHKVFAGLGDLAKVTNEADLLDVFARQAKDLVHGTEHRAAVFLEGTPDEPHDTIQRWFVFRAPSGLEPKLSPYCEGGEGLTSHVIRTKKAVLSINLPHDLAKGELKNVKHSSKVAETGKGSTKSWVGVPIFEARTEPEGQEARVLGAVRVSSPQLAAFSVRDLTTLQVLANQLSWLLRILREREHQDRVMTTFVQTSTRPVIANNKDSQGSVSMINDAACELLGRRANEITGQPIVDVVYGGNRPMAVETLRAVHDAKDNKLRQHYAVVFRKSSVGTRAIPIPVRFDATYLRQNDPRKPTHDAIGTVGFLEHVIDARLPDRVVEGGSPNNFGMTADPVFIHELDKLRLLARVPRDSHVLIHGETGVGKELLVDEICHRIEIGNGAKLHQTKINCAELPEGIIESELFGSVKGAFNGATDRSGIFNPKDFKPDVGGILFLDEIAELSMTAQAKLLRVIEKGVVRRVGARVDEKIEVQIIAATSANLDQRVKEDKFRKDLLYRLTGVEFRVPPLRERPYDIMLLAFFFVERCCGSATKHGFDSMAVRALMQHDWLGNVRELRNTVESAWRYASSEDRELIKLHDLPPRLAKPFADEIARERSASLDYEKRYPAPHQSMRVERPKTETVIRSFLADNPSIRHELDNGADRQPYVERLQGACLQMGGVGVSRTQVLHALADILGPKPKKQRLR